MAFCLSPVSMAFQLKYPMNIVPKNPYPPNIKDKIHDNSKLWIRNIYFFFVSRFGLGLTSNIPSIEFCSCVLGVMDILAPERCSNKLWHRKISISLGFRNLFFSNFWSHLVHFWFITFAISPQKISLFIEINLKKRTIIHFF